MFSIRRIFKLASAILLGALLCAMPSGSESAPTRYCVIDEILPVMLNPGDPYLMEDGVLRPAPGSQRPEAAVVFGNHVDIEHIRGKYAGSWARMLTPGDGVTVGYIETRGLTALPNFEEHAPARYIVRKDNPDLRLLPGRSGERLPLADRGFTLLKGEVVQAFGRVTDAGKLWIMLGFSTDLSGGGDPGFGMRYAWAPAETLLPLDDYAPNYERNDDEWVPTRAREFAGPPTTDFSPEENDVYLMSSALRTRLLVDGFRIDMTPAIPEAISDTDEMTSLYRYTAPYAPDFITTDVMHRAYFILLDRIQTDAERHVFIPRIKAALTTALASLEKAALPAELNGARDLARDTLALPLCLLGEIEVGALSGRARTEARRIEAASGAEESPFSGGPEDYTLYKPAGRYAGDPELERYYRAMTFLSRSRISLFETNGTVSGRGTVAAVLLALALSPQYGGWSRAADPIDLLMGTADDTRAADFIAAVTARMPSYAGVKNLADPSTIESLAYELRAEMGVRRGHGLEFRIWGRRREETYFPDADGTPEPLPSREIKGEAPAPQESAAPPAVSKQVFFSSGAWQWKKLMTASAADAERARGEALYGRRPDAADSARDGRRFAGPFAPPMPRGYVEPDAAAFAKIIDDVERVKKFVTHYSLDDLYGASGWSERLARFSSLCADARRIADAEARDAILSDADYMAIKEIARSLGGDLLLAPGDSRRRREGRELRMASTSPKSSAIGVPNAVYVFVSDRSGGPRTAKGWVYSFYEFPRSASAGMTDEAWRSIVYDPARAGELNRYRPGWYSELD